LPTFNQLDRVNVVLVSPRNPLNIGAAARAMANFGFSRLTVVAPYAPHWREARSAIGAPELLQRATETGNIAEAVSDCTFVIGTGTLTYRKPEQPVVSLPDLAPLVLRELQQNGRIGLVFGPEKHGLTREDLSYCHALVEIPTDEHQPSMNLGQAVAVCLYELAVHISQPRQAKKKSPLNSASIVAHTSGVSSARLDLLADLVAQVMETSNYSPASMNDANHHDLRLLLRRLSLPDKDIRRILGLMRRVLWRLKR
jgi:TrmH family RNA methyltransferase